MASFHGRLPEFSGTSEDWSVFAEQLTHYFTASGMSDAAKQRAVLLSTCGTPTYKLMKTLTAPADITTKTFAELVQLMQNHLHPKPSVIMRRFGFNACVRQQGKAISSYVTRLRDIRLQLRRFDQRTHTLSPRLRHPR